MIDVVLPAAPSAVPVRCVREGALDGVSPAARETARVADFTGQAGRVLTLHGADGALEQVLFGVGEQGDAMLARQLPAKLPPGEYRLEAMPEGWEPTAAATAFALGSYVFDRYKSDHRHGRVRLVAPEGADLAEVRRVAHACAMARDLVNTPANDMGPHQIEAVAREIAESAGAQLTVVAGDALLEADYPAVHAVGRAAAAHRAPRVVEIRWGDSGPLIALVGKGVVFDSGGLNIKTGSGMRIMKKDMGGAAHALALGRMIMDAKLPVRLVVLTPLVENAISADAFRPGDVISTRKGLSVEIGNTDAEGRLILADALAYAAEQGAERIVNLATLTGAIIVALGSTYAGLFSNDDGWFGEVQAACEATGELGWRLPLHPEYLELTKGRYADLTNAAEERKAMSIYAAEFLRQFVDDRPWVHVDIAGTAWGLSRPYVGKGASGFGVRMLVELASRGGSAR